MRRVAGLHDHPVDVAIGEVALELHTNKAMLLNPTTAIDDGHLVDVRCRIDGGGCRTRFGRPR